MSSLLLYTAKQENIVTKYRGSKGCLSTALYISIIARGPSTPQDEANIISIRVHGAIILDRQTEKVFSRPSIEY